jgi:hypothetical protein
LAVKGLDLRGQFRTAAARGAQEKTMKANSAWASALLLAVTATGLNLQAGVIMITTRKNADTGYGTDRVEMRGPGMTSPGDVAMGTLLGNYGYSSRLVLEVLLATSNPLNERSGLLGPAADTNFNISLLIVSGSSASADIPEPPLAEAIPVMMGEHVTLGNNSGRPGSIYMYNGTMSNDPNESGNATKYMKVLVPDHPILQGIPLDASGRVKIFRDPYPNEEQNVPPGGRRNFEYRWCTQTASDAAAGTTVLGVLDDDNTRSCLAVVDVGGLLANDTMAPARLVHMFTNENGSGGSRRVFLALTDLGQIIFVRAAKWAMGETLAPYSPFQITQLQPAGPQHLKLSWEASASHNYKIQASADFKTWQTLVEDLPGVDGALSHTLDLSAAPPTVFFRVAATP